MRRPVLRFLVLFLALFVCLLLTYPMLLGGLGRVLIEEQGPFRADAAVALGGDYTCGRIVKAGELVQQGWVSKAIASGGMKMFGRQEPDLAVSCAVEKGLPAGIFVPIYTNALSTSDEAEKLRQPLSELGVRKLIVVTSKYHTRRAGRTFRRILGPGIAIQVVGVPDPFWSPDAWWKNREGRKTEFYEWTKTAADWVGW